MLNEAKKFVENIKQKPPSIPKEESKTSEKNESSKGGGLHSTPNPLMSERSVLGGYVD